MHREKKLRFTSFLAQPKRKLKNNSFFPFCHIIKAIHRFHPLNYWTTFLPLMFVMGECEKVVHVVVPLPPHRAVFWQISYNSSSFRSLSSLVEVSSIFHYATASGKMALIFTAIVASSNCEFFFFISRMAADVMSQIVRRGNFNSQGLLNFIKRCLLLIKLN